MTTQIDRDCNRLLDKLESMKEAGSTDNQEYMRVLLELRALNNKRLVEFGIKIQGVNT